MSSLAQKLRLGPGLRAAVVNAPPGYVRRLEPLPEGVQIRTRPAAGMDFVQLFARYVAELQALGPAVIRAAKADGLHATAAP